MRSFFRSSQSLTLFEAPAGCTTTNFLTSPASIFLFIDGLDVKSRRLNTWSDGSDDGGVAAHAQRHPFSVVLFSSTYLAVPAIELGAEGPSSEPCEGRLAPTSSPFQHTEAQFLISPCVSELEKLWQASLAVGQPMSSREAALGVRNPKGRVNSFAPTTHSKAAAMPDCSPQPCASTSPSPSTASRSPPLPPRLPSSSKGTTTVRSLALAPSKLTPTRSSPTRRLGEVLAPQFVREVHRLPLEGAFAVSRVCCRS